MSGKNRELNWKITKVNQASPMRLCAIHWCYSDEAWRESMAISKTAVSKSQQIRIRVYHGTSFLSCNRWETIISLWLSIFCHFFISLGSIQQCLEELRGVGIDPRSIPIDCNGDITDLEEARQRWEAQRRYERLNFPLRSTFYVPFSQDVLLGKGTPFQDHPGNKRFRELISDHIKQYDKAQRAQKKTIAMEIIDTIRQSGGLFLKQDVGGKHWSRVDDDAATLKVTATFRSYRRAVKRTDHWKKACCHTQRDQRNNNSEWILAGRPVLSSSSSEIYVLVVVCVDTDTSWNPGKNMNRLRLKRWRLWVGKALLDFP